MITGALRFCGFGCDNFLQHTRGVMHYGSVGKCLLDGDDPRALIKYIVPLGQQRIDKLMVVYFCVDCLAAVDGDTLVDFPGQWHKL